MKRCKVILDDIPDTTKLATHFNTRVVSLVQDTLIDDSTIVGSAIIKRAAGIVGEEDCSILRSCVLVPGTIQAR
jgi:hypothetical protein